MSAAQTDGRAPHPLLRPATLARGVAANLAGAAVPAVLGLAALPLLEQGLGVARLGVLTLAWTVLGYLALMHLGMGRALTQAAGQGLGERLAPAFWSAMAVTGGAGVLAGVALLAGAAPLVRALRLPPELAPEALAAFRLLSLALPFTVSAPALSALLEARGRFGRVSAVGATVSAATYLGPLAALALGGGLPAIVGVLAAARALGWAALAVLCLRQHPELRVPARPHASTAAEMLRFGGWTTVSAVATPVLVYLDRFVVATLISATAVAYYATPQEVVFRLGMLASAVGGVLFPAVATASRHAPERVGPLLLRGSQAAFALVLPFAVAAAAFAGEGLRVWLGPDWSEAARVPVAWLAVGVLVNGQARVTAATLQGMGRPDFAARLHLVEIALYLPLLFWMVQRYGLVGAAVAWTARMVVDTAGLLWGAARILPAAAGEARRAGAMVAAGVLAVAAGTLPLPGWARGVWVAVAACATAGMGVRWLASLRAAAGPRPLT